MMPEDERSGVADADDDEVIEPHDYTGDYPFDPDEDNEAE